MFADDENFYTKLRTSLETFRDDLTDAREEHRMRRDEILFSDAPFTERLRLRHQEDLAHTERLRTIRQTYDDATGRAFPTRSAPTVAATPEPEASVPVVSKPQKALPKRERSRNWIRMVPSPTNHFEDSSSPPHREPRSNGEFERRFDRQLKRDNWRSK